MSAAFLVGFDETEAARRALKLAATTARVTGARVHLVHVLEWSPYSFLTQAELAARHRRRVEELTRAQKIVGPVVAELSASGIQATSETRYGRTGEIIL